MFPRETVGPTSGIFQHNEQPQLMLRQAARLKIGRFAKNSPIIPIVELGAVEGNPFQDRKRADFADGCRFGANGDGPFH